MNQFISFLIIIIAFSSCFPEGEDDFESTQLRGTVVEFGTLDPVPNALVPLFGVVSQGGLQNPILYLVDTVRTDIDGEFYFLTDDDATTFEIGKISADGFFPYEGNQSKLVFPGENEFYMPEFVMNPVGWIRVIVQDVDSLDIPFLRINATFIPGSPGSSENRNEIFVVKSNRFHEIWRKETDNQPLIIDSIFSIAYDTVEYQFYH